jgi:hypothetical protein
MRHALCGLIPGLLVLGVASVGGEEPINVPTKELGQRYLLVGKLHAPMGQTVTVQGVVVEGPFKGYEGGPNLRPQRIDGQAMQEDIQICITPYWRTWADWYSREKNDLPKLEKGKTYEMVGYTTGGYVGIPGKAYEEAGIPVQTTDHYFREVFEVIKFKPIDPILFTPHDFIKRKALLQGTAESSNNRAMMKGESWTVIVNPKEPWPKNIEGKPIETYGTYEPVTEGKEYKLVDGSWRLVRLEDQVGRPVELRGTARSTNGEWWFHYRGVDLYVEDMKKMPNWSDENYWRPMVIRGILEKAVFPYSPNAHENLSTTGPSPKEYFIVRKSTWEPLNELLSMERPYNDPYCLPLRN